MTDTNDRSFGRTRRFKSYDARKDAPPGPGMYRPEDSKKKVLERSASARFGSKQGPRPASAQPRRRKKKGAAGSRDDTGRALWRAPESPGPGAYASPRGTVAWRVELASRTAAQVSSVPRFGSDTTSVPGPGAYGEPTTTPRKVVGPSMPRAQSLTSVNRVKSMHVRGDPKGTWVDGGARLAIPVPDTPGPGAYRSKVTIDKSAELRNKAAVAGFGLTARFVVRDPYPNLGPGSYDPMKAIRELDAKRGYTPPNPDAREPEHWVGEHGPEGGRGSPYGAGYGAVSTTSGRRSPGRSTRGRGSPSRSVRSVRSPAEGRAGTPRDYYD